MTEDGRHSAVAAFLRARVDEGWMPGAAWWVESEGRLVGSGVVGRAVVEPKDVAAFADTPYDWASLTKPLGTALLLVLLEHEGRIDLRQPVECVLDELRGAWCGRASLLDLARHESGLPAWLPLYLEARDVEGYLRRIARESPAAAVGTVLYSDLGYIVLGAAVERAAGCSLDRLFAERVAQPLGLPRVGFAGPSRCFGDAAATERGNGHERTMVGPGGANHPWRAHVLRGEVHDGNAHGLGGVAGHAGLFGTVAEAAAIGRELLEPRALGLSAAARARLLAPGLDGGRTVGFTSAVLSQAARGILPPSSPGHTGFTGTSIWLDPRVPRILVLLTNRVHPVVGTRDFQWLRRGFHRAALLDCGRTSHLVGGSAPRP